EARGSVRGDRHPVPFQLELELVELGHVTMVLEHQDAWRSCSRHGFPSSDAGSNVRGHHPSSGSANRQDAFVAAKPAYTGAKNHQTGAQLVGLADCGDLDQCWQPRAVPPSPPISNECPQEQLETAFGLCTVKPPPIRLSTKSISAPLMYRALTESTNRRTPPTSRTLSPSSGWSSNPMP